jgi:hypothetical protein
LKKGNVFNCHVDAVTTDDEFTVSRAGPFKNLLSLSLTLIVTRPIPTFNWRHFNLAH